MKRQPGLLSDSIRAGCVALAEGWCGLLPPVVVLLGGEGSPAAGAVSSHSKTPPPSFRTRHVSRLISGEART